MTMNIPLYTLILCTLIISCTNKPKQEETPHAPINNVVEINDTLKAVATEAAIVLSPNLLPSKIQIFIALNKAKYIPARQ